ncbi:MAG: hypothetical protein AB8B87_09380 [Granulosicoccus sp.]
MLSMITPIKEVEIEDVAVLRPGTVYKLHGHAGDVIVVKKEAGNVNKTQLKHARRVMKTVDANAGNVKPLNNAEQTELLKWANFMISATAQFANNAANYPAVTAATEIRQLFAHGVGHSLWYKMPLSDLTPADKILDARMGVGGAVDKSGTVALTRGLKNDGGLEQLGRIIAADMFINNTDRFCPPGGQNIGSQRQYGAKNLKFETLCNIGNLFMIGKTTNFDISVSGHDFFDPASGYRDFDSTLAVLAQNYNEDWLGESLCSGRSRRAFAKAIIRDLETLLCPNRKRVSLRTKLGMNSFRRIEAGFLDGMQRIVTQTNLRYAGRNDQPVGLAERVQKFAAALA